jgi:hypothetical protein
MKNSTLVIFAALPACIPARALTCALVCVLACVLPSCKPKAPAVVPTFGVIEKTQNLQTTTGNFEIAYRFEYLATLADTVVLRKIEREMSAEFFGADYGRFHAVEGASAFDRDAGEVYGIRDGSAFRWDGYLHLTSKASLVGEHTIAYTVDRVEDSGGAHGMAQTRYANWDIRTGNRLTVDDLFTPEGKAALEGTIRAKILADKGAKDWGRLAAEQCYNPETEALPLDNFLLSATDITFTYNPYEIACYAAGDTRVSVPLANLAGFEYKL